MSQTYVYNIQQLDQTELVYFLKKVTSLDLVNENLDYIQNEQHQHHINFPCVSIESISMVNTCSTSYIAMDYPYPILYWILVL